MAGWALFIFIFIFFIFFFIGRVGRLRLLFVICFVFIAHMCPPITIHSFMSTVYLYIP